MGKGQVTISHALTAAACVLPLLLAPLLMSGTPPRIVLALSALAAPIALWIAVKRPMLFPFAAYVFLIPFDNLLGLSTFGTLTRILGLFAGLAFAWWMIRHRSVVKPPSSLMLWLALIAWAGVTLLWTSDVANGLRMLGTLAQIVMLYAVVSMMPVGGRDVRTLLVAIIGGGVAASVFGLYLFHHQDPAQWELQRELGRLQIQLGENAIDVNHFANALLLPIAALLVIALNERHLLRKLFYGGLLATMIAAVYVSASREALVGIGVMLVYLVVVSRKRLQLIIAAVIGGILSILNPAVWQRFAEASTTGGAGRTSIWAVGLEALKHYWLLGSGAGSFTNAYDEAYIAVFQHNPAGWTRNAHNVLIGTSVELGVIGLLLLVAGWVAQYRLLRFVERGSRLDQMRTIAIAALTGLTICAFFIDLSTYKYVWLVFMLIAQARALAVLQPELALAQPQSAATKEFSIHDYLWRPSRPSHAR